MANSSIGSEGDLGRDLDRAAAAVATAARVVVVTGAGMSRESGVPTFRDAREGLWSRFDPGELATRRGFRSDPARVWTWYNYRRGLVASAEPHAGHHALRRLEDRVAHLAVVTQNIDGLHQRAGSSRVLELHGSLSRFKCFANGHPCEVEGAPLRVVPPDRDESIAPPECPECGSPVRPDVVWFGEPLDAEVLARAEAFARGADVMLVVGTSGIVYPAAALPAVAGATGAMSIEVNIDRSELTDGMDLHLRGPAGRRLPELVERVERAQGVR